MSDEIPGASDCAKALLRWDNEDEACRKKSQEGSPSPAEEAVPDREPQPTDIEAAHFSSTGVGERASTHQADPNG